MAAPAQIDQVAASLVVALDGVAPGEINEAAVDLLGPFSAGDRGLIGTKAVNLGADPSSVQMAIVAAGAADSSEVINVTGTAPGQVMKASVGVLSRIPPWAWLVGIAGAGYWWSKRKRR